MTVIHIKAIPGRRFERVYGQGHCVDCAFYRSTRVVKGTLTHEERNAGCDWDSTQTTNCLNQSLNYKEVGYDPSR